MPVEGVFGAENSLDLAVERWDPVRILTIDRPWKADEFAQLFPSPDLDDLECSKI
jgi:hypothetical protein